MTKLRFIKPWGPYKPGETKETDQKSTIHWLVDVYKFAVIETPDNPIATAPPDDTITDTTAQKFIRNAPRDKMTKSSFNKAKRY
jgi:hypothetical protein